MDEEPAETSEAPRRPRRAWQWIKRLLTLAVLAGAGAGWWWYSEYRTETSSAPTYELAPVERGDVVTLVTASGTLSPLVQVEVGSQVSGRVKELFVDYNDVVARGQLIATIDPSLCESALRQAEARLLAARADLVRAEAQATGARAKYRRLAGLEETGAVPRVDVDAARADWQAAAASVDSAEASVTLAEASVEEAKANLAYTRITSPTDGVVVSVSVDVGQTVQASFSAPTLFVIAEDLRKMEVHTNVAESDVGRISRGQRVEFGVDAYPERTFAGTVRQVRYAPQTVSNVVTYDAVVTVSNDDLRLLPGMTANVSFIVEERRGVTTVPAAAFRYRPAGSRPTDAGVWVLRAGRPTLVRVQPGLSDGGVTEVIGTGLRDGESVVLGDGSAAAGSGAAAGAGVPAAGASSNRRSGGMGGPPPPPGFF